jgi:hypothetical protein
MNVNVEVHKKLSEYFSGKLNLNQLRDWQVQFRVDRANLDADDQRFLSEFEGRYAEYLHGDHDELKFKQRLASAIGNHAIKANTDAFWFWVPDSVNRPSAHTTMSVGVQQTGTTRQPELVEEVA